MNQFSKEKQNNLEERTAIFAENVIDFLRSLKVSPLNKRIIDQLVGSSGSIGANYCEAVEAESRKDFIHKIGIAKKEIKETKHWLRLLAKAEPESKEKLRPLYSEAMQLLLIFSKIFTTSRARESALKDNKLKTH